MRHQVSGRKLGRTTSHRRAMFKNMMASMIINQRLETTLPKAKELRSFADHLITLGKANTLSAKREVFRLVRSRDLVKKLFLDLAPKFHDRQGGYTRLLKLGYRLGDGAPMALIEYLPSEKEKVEEMKNKKEKVKSKK